LGKLAELRDSGIPIYFFVGIMICGWKIISRRIEHSVFMSNQNTLLAEKPFNNGHNLMVLESKFSNA
jgi:hypothetical protein